MRSEWRPEAAQLAHINNNTDANVDIHRKQNGMINDDMIINISSLVPRPHLLSRGRLQGRRPWNPPTPKDEGRGVRVEGFLSLIPQFAP